MQDDWASKALPRLYCRLFTSDKALESFSKVDTTALIKILQEVADICWPGHSYPIKKGSGYLETVCCSVTHFLYVYIFDRHTTIVLRSGAALAMTATSKFQHSF